MKKVLIIGPNFHYFNASIERAFVSLGWKTEVCAFDTPIHPYNFANKMLYKFGNKDKLKKITRSFLTASIEKISTILSRFGFYIQ